MLDYVKTAKWTLVILLACAGCQYAQVNPGDPNNPVVLDPNALAALEAAAQTVTQVGIAIGYGKLIAIGAILTAIATALKKRYSGPIKKTKK